MAESPKGDVPAEVRAKATEMALHFCCVFVDALFLFLWASTNFVVNRLIKWCQLEGSDSIVALVLQALFGIATLIPIAIFIYRDIRLMWIRTALKIAKAI
jgi:hypothetical protein